MYYVSRWFGIGLSWMTMALPHVCTKALEGGSWLQQKEPVLIQLISVIPGEIYGPVCF